ncbi:hypothetical protein NIES2107_59230 [Nostoc carneum NIES-2107]|nr:hypothetical protein NIES2107_59230 [Nostoc carneum NIES-2107]BAY92318.1 hypothetical protein NIES3275_43520 [Microchaete diplosiphon NIES-3275]
MVNRFFSIPGAIASLATKKLIIKLPANLEEIA